MSLGGAHPFENTQAFGIERRYGILDKTGRLWPNIVRALISEERRGTHCAAAQLIETARGTPRAWCSQPERGDGRLLVELSPHRDKTAH